MFTQESQRILLTSFVGKPELKTSGDTYVVPQYVSSSFNEIELIGDRVCPMLCVVKLESHKLSLKKTVLVCPGWKASIIIPRHEIGSQLALGCTYYYFKPGQIMPAASLADKSVELAFVNDTSPLPKEGVFRIRGFSWRRVAYLYELTLIPGHVN